MTDFPTIQNRFRSHGEYPKEELIRDLQLLVNELNGTITALNVTLNTAGFDRLTWVDFMPTIVADFVIEVPLDSWVWIDFAPIVNGADVLISVPLDSLTWVDFVPVIDATALREYSSAFSSAFR